MTRKDYVLIAKGFQNAFTESKGTMETDETILLAISKISEQLAMDNPNFDVTRFRKACMPTL